MPVNPFSVQPLRCLWLAGLRLDVLWWPYHQEFSEAGSKRVDVRLVAVRKIYAATHTTARELLQKVTLCADHA